MDKLHDNATPEEISTHLNELLPKLSSGFAPEVNEHLPEVVKQANFTPEHMNMAVDHLTSPESEVELGHLEPLVDSHHFNQNHANKVMNYIADTVEGEKSDLLNKVLEKHPDTDKTPFERNAIADIEDKDISPKDMSDYSGAKFSPQFLHNILKSRPEYTSGDDLTPEQEENNQKAHKTDLVVFNNLPHAKHTPESLKQAIELGLSDSISNHTASAYRKPTTGSDIQASFLGKLIDNQDLSKDDLNKIYQKADEIPEVESRYSYRGSGRHELMHKVLEHKNVDPILLAKVAKMDAEDWKAGSRKRTALSNPSLPHETINSIISDDDSLNDNISDLIRNPSLTKEQLNTIAQKGYSKYALNHENTDHDLHRNFWQNSDKSTEAARTILETKNPPTDILKELVNHKNKNVAIDALNHPKADASVIEEGLKRKMKDVQDVARKHPLVAEQEMKKGFAEGKVKLSDALGKEAENAHFQKLSPEEKSAAYEKFSDNLKGTNAEEIAKKSKELPDDIFKLKLHLATSKDSPEHVKKQNAKDIIDAFSSKTPHNSTDFDYDHRKPLKNMYQAFNTLVASGDKDAKETALKKIGYLHDLSRHFRYNEGKEKVDGDFLNKAYDKIIESKGQGIVNRQGFVNDIGDKDVKEALREAVKFPNLPEEKFTEFLKKYPEDDHSQRFLSNGRRYDYGTLFDERYEKLPEEEKRARFQKFMNPIQAFGVAASKTAPQDMRDQAFEMLDPKEKHELIHEADNKFDGFGPNILRNALAGKYDDEQLSPKKQGKSKYEEYALDRLNSDNPEHHAVLDEYLTNTANKVSGTERPHSDEVIKSLGGEWFKNFDLFKKHMRGHSALYLESLSNDLKDKISQTRNAKSYSAPFNTEKQDEVINHLKNEEKDFTSALPWSDPDTIKTLFWNKLLDDKSDKYESNKIEKLARKDEQDKTSSNGKLDFLADLAKKDKGIKNLILQKHLLSPQKEEEVKNTFASLGEYLDSIPQYRIGSEIRDRLAKYKSGELPHPTKDDLTDILNRLDPSALAEGNIFKALDSENKQTAEENLKHIYDLAKSTHAGTYENVKAVQRLLGQEAFVKKDKEYLTKTITDHILSSPEAPGYSKTDELNDLIEGITKADLDFAPVINKIADYAAEKGDTEALVNLYQKVDVPPKSLSTKITNTIKNAKDLNTSQILPLTDLFSNSNFTTKNIKTIDSLFESKIQQESASGIITPEQETELRQNYANKISEIDVHSPDDKVKFATATMQKYRTFEATNSLAVNYLYKSLKSNSLDNKDKKAIYLSLPSELPGTAQTGVSKYGTLSSEMVNDPEILENSTSGWKLNSLAASVENMSQNTVSIFVNRVVTSEDNSGLSNFAKRIDDTYLNEKPFVLNKISQKSNTKPEDIKKLLRYMNDDEIANYIENSPRNLVETQISPLLDHLTEGLVSTHDSSTFEKYQPEHLAAIKAKTDMIGAIFENSKYDEENMGSAKEMLSSYSNALKTVCGTYDKMLDIHKDGDSLYSDLKPFHQSLLDLSKASIPLSGEDLVSSFATLKQIEKKAHPDDFAYEQNLNIYENLFKKAENVKSDVFQHLALEHPVYPFLLYSSDTITKPMLDAMNFEKFNESDESDWHYDKWFDKMGSEALETHGFKILSEISSKIKNSDRISLELSSAVKSGLRYGNRYLDYGQVKQIFKNIENESATAKECEDICLENGVGGSELLNDIYTKNASKGTLSDILGGIASSPSISDEIAEKIIQNDDQENSSENLRWLAKNNYLSTKYADKIAEKLLTKRNQGHGKYETFLSDLVRHPKISYEKAKEIFNVLNDGEKVIFRGGNKFQPIFSNPTHGSRFLRELPPTSPDELNKYKISADKMQRDILVGGKTKEKLYEAMQIVPPEGMGWVEFKKKKPNLENHPEIKNIFMSKNGKPVMPEDFNGALQEADEKDKYNSFHVTFSAWDRDLQVHNRSALPNLVVQLNSSQKTDDELSKDPKTWALYQMVLKKSNGISGENIGTHPTTPHLISWSRVDVSNKDCWIIEEFQSDVAQKFRKNLRSMLKSSPSGLKLGDEFVTASEIKKHLSKIDEAFSYWQKASMDAVIKNAKAHGIKKLYIHGMGIRSTMSGGGTVGTIDGTYNKNHINPRIVEIYDGTAQKYGFQKCDYTDYPNYSSSTLSDTKKRDLPTYCWYLDI